jgi:hypothetical protein
LQTLFLSLFFKIHVNGISILLKHEELSMPNDKKRFKTPKSKFDQITEKYNTAAEKAKREQDAALANAKASGKVPTTLPRYQKAMDTIKAMLVAGGTGAGAGFLAGGPVGAIASGLLGALSAAGIHLAQTDLSDEALAKRYKRQQDLLKKKNSGGINTKEQEELDKIDKTFKIIEEKGKDTADNRSFWQKFKDAANSDTTQLDPKTGLPKNVFRIDKYTPDQKQVLNDLLGYSSQGLLGQKPYSFDDIRNEEIRRFKEETIPLISNRFAAHDNLRSGAFNRMLARAEQEGQSQLAALGVNYQNQEREHLKDLLRAGLTEQTDIAHVNPEKTLLRSILEGIPGLAGKGLDLYLNSQGVPSNFGGGSAQQSGGTSSATSALNNPRINQNVLGAKAQPANAVYNPLPTRQQLVLQDVLQGRPVQYGADAAKEFFRV